MILENKRNCCGCCRDFLLLEMLFFLLFYGSIGGFSALFAMEEKGAAYFCVALCILVFIFNLILLCSDRALEFISNIQEDVTSKDHIATVKNSRPKFIYNIECYHYNKRDHELKSRDL